MKKNVIALALIIVMMISMTAMADNDVEKAIPSPQSVMLNGELVKISAYNIADENYFKLRDVAALLKDTSAKFDVVFDTELNTVGLISNKAYEPTKQDLAPIGPEMMNAVKSGNRIALQSELIDIKAFSIQDYNYFRLRDLGAVLKFDVEYDAIRDAVLITTDPADKIPILKNEGEKSEKTIITEVVVKKLTELPESGNLDIIEDLKDFKIKDAKELPFKWDYSKQEDEFQILFPGSDKGIYAISSMITQEGMKDERVDVKQGVITQEAIGKTETDVKKPYTIYVLGIDKQHKDAPLLSLIEYHIGEQ